MLYKYKEILRKNVIFVNQLYQYEVKQNLWL